MYVVMFLNLGEVALCRRHPVNLSTVLPSCHPEAGSREVSGLHLQTWSSVFKTLVFLLAMSVPWWVRLL